MMVVFLFAGVFGFLLLAVHQHYRMHVAGPEALCRNGFFYAREYANNTIGYFLEGFPVAWYEVPFIRLDLSRLKRMHPVVRTMYYKGNTSLEATPEFLQECEAYREKLSAEWEGHEGRVCSSIIRHAPYDYRDHYYQLPVTSKEVSTELSMS